MDRDIPVESLEEAVQVLADESRKAADAEPRMVGVTFPGWRFYFLVGRGTTITGINPATTGATDER